MALFKILDMHVIHGIGNKATTYAPGDMIELSADEAARLGKNVTPAEPKKGKKDKNGEDGEG